MPSQTTTDDALGAVIKTVSPAGIAEAMEDPSIFEMVARGDLYVELGRLRQLAQNPSMPTTMRLEYVKFLSKMGKVDKPEGPPVSATANLPQINIILPNAGSTTSLSAGPKQRVLEHE